MFQEAILRNMPFCDEFIVITNKKYENIARGQLQYFQGLNYTIMLENTPLKTAPSVVISALYAQPDEELLIVFTDHVIEGEYNPAIIRLKSIIKAISSPRSASVPPPAKTDFIFSTSAARRPDFLPKRPRTVITIADFTAARRR